MNETNTGTASSDRQLSRRKLLRHSASAGLVGLGITTLAGCTSPAAPTPAASSPVAPPGAAPPAPATTPTTAAVQPKYGGVLSTMTTGLERHLDPHTAGGPAGTYGAIVCYSQLIAFKYGPEINAPSYLVGPDLAESWTQPDDLTYIFKLRPGVKWHNIAPVNGRELVADDITYSFQRIIDLKTYASILASVGKIEAVDRSTVKITLEKVNADFLPGLCSQYARIVAKEVVDRNGNLEGPPVIGTGPWLFEKWSANDGLVTKRNPDYFLKGLPYADGYETYRSADPSFPDNAFRAKKINVLGTAPSPETQDQLKKDIPGVAFKFILNDAVGDELGLNVTRPPFNNLKVRQAVSKAIDPQQVIDTIYRGQAKLAAGITLPQLDWSLPEAELNQLKKRDLDTAKRLMREAGADAGFDVEVLVADVRQQAYVHTAELLQQQLKDINVRLTIRIVDANAFTQATTTKQYAATIGYAAGLGATNQNLFGWHYSNGALNRYGYSNPDMDKLIDQQATMGKDPAGRRRILEQIQRLIIDQAYAINIEDLLQPYAHYPEVKDIYPPQLFSASTQFWTTTWIDK
jgi:peptide/nickel transport system substrate-binding protein